MSTIINIFKHSSFLLFFILCIFVSCDDAENPVQPDKNNLVDYDQFSRAIMSDFKHIGSLLRNKNSKFSDVPVVMNVAEEYYGSTSENYNAFQNSFDKMYHYKGQKSSESLLTDFQRKATAEIMASVTMYATVNEFQQYLDDSFQKYLNTDLPKNDKDFILIFIKLYKASLDYLVESPDLMAFDTENVSRSQGWWNKWGKCVAGILGAAGTESLAGCGIGAAAGLVVLSIPGCGVGAIAGGVAGALTGAAIFC